jgi:signal peptidase I
LRLAPNLLPSDFIVALRNARLSRGSVVVYTCTEDEKHYCARRLIGLPGDRVEFNEGRLTLNGRPATYSDLNERGIAREKWLDYERAVVLGSTALQAMVIPPEHYYVIDDNRGYSLQPGGLIHQDSIQGRAWRIWLSLDWYSDGKIRPWPRLRYSPYQCHLSVNLSLVLSS